MIHTTQTRLDLVHFAVHREISRYEILDAIAPEIVIQDTARGLVLELVAGIMGRASRQVYRYPATWWDAFKVRWFWAWALRRWPARWVTFSAETTEIFPDIVPVPGQRSIVRHTLTKAEGTFRVE